LWVLSSPLIPFGPLFPITQESYERCVAGVKAARQENIAICVKQFLAEDLEKSRKELPVLPSRAVREADCRFIWGTTPPDNCRPPPRNSNCVEELERCPKDSGKKVNSSMTKIS
jgi:hypothetical protein